MLTTLTRQRVVAVSGALSGVLVLGSIASVGHAARGGRETLLPFAEGLLARAPWMTGWMVLSLSVWSVAAATLRLNLGTDESSWRLRQAIALPAWLLMFVHMWWVWARPWLSGGDTRFVYAHLFQVFGRAEVAWGYGFGIVFTGIFVEQALLSWGEVFHFPTRERSRLWYRGFALMLPLLLVLVAYNELAALVAGAPLLGAGAP